MVTSLKFAFYLLLNFGSGILTDWRRRCRRTHHRAEPYYTALLTARCQNIYSNVMLCVGLISFDRFNNIFKWAIYLLALWSPCRDWIVIFGFSIIQVVRCNCLAHTTFYPIIHVMGRERNRLPSYLQHRILNATISYQRAATFIFRVLVPCINKRPIQNIRRANYPISVTWCGARICNCHGSA